MVKVLPLVVLTGLIGIVYGCGSAHRGADLDLERAPELSGDVRVEAYLFDAKLRRNNKPTSLRLEFYHTDSVIAMAGRGYLGKGALRGRLTADSMEVYFPTTDEYLVEPVTKVLGAADCSAPLPSISLLQLFNSLPDSMLEGSNFVVESDYSDARHPRFLIRSPDCLWEMNVEYALQQEGWRIREFAFDDGDGITLTGTRRTYKREAKVKATKFLVPVKPTSMRIMP